LKKNNFIRLLSILFLLILTSCTPGEITEFTDGSEVYSARCSACHGKNFEGKIGPSLSANSPSAQMPDSYWVQTITKGKGSMPAQRLTDNEVRLVIEYIKSKY